MAAERHRNRTGRRRRGLIALGLITYRRTLRGLEEEGVRAMAQWPVAGLAVSLLLVAGAGVVLMVRN